MRTRIWLLSIPLSVVLTACVTQQPTLQVTVPTASQISLSYAASDTAQDVARDITQQFPRLSAYLRYPQTVTSSIGDIHKTGVIATYEGNKIYLDYRHYRMIVAAGAQSELATSTNCELTISPILGAPGKFKVESSPLSEKIGRQLFIPLSPVAPIAQIAADVKNTLMKLGQSEEARQVSLLRDSAGSGDAHAQNDLGVRYAKGLGVPQDNARAVMWYLKAASQGYAIAQHNLGRMYFYGIGVPKDFVEVVGWYRKAADQGYPNAQNDLGVMYANGDGVMQNFVQAYTWWMLSKANSTQGSEPYENAKRNMDAFAVRMTADQLAQAQRSAAAWVAASSK